MKCSLRFGWILVFVFLWGQTNAQNLRISGGNGHSVAICANGNVFGWGKNDVGQIGLDNTFTAHAALDFNSPERVYGLQEIFQIDAGSGSHTLALTCDGQIQAWGFNQFGQLGDGNSGAGLFSATPVFVQNVGGGGNINGVSYVSAGNDESFAIMADQRAVSWGQNDRGQLGDGTTINRLFPVYVQDGLTGGDMQDVIQIEAGDENGYALIDPDGDGIGTVYSWGDATDNAGYALGRTTKGTNLVALPVERPDGSYLDDIVEVTAGDRHGLAIDANGNVWGWGGDWGHGQVGDGPGYYTQDYASQVVGGASGDTYLGDSDPVVHVSASQASSAAVTASGKVYSWGADGFYNCGNGCSSSSGQLGVGCLATYDDGGGVNTSPMESTKAGGIPFNDAIGISDGDGWMFVLTDDNSIWVTGWNGEGELGLGNYANRCEYEELVIPSCGITAPCPNPNLSLDFEECPGFSRTLNAGLVYPDFTVEWYLDGGLEGTESVTSGQNPREITHNATQFGTWEVRVIDNRPATDRPCDPCAVGIDDVVITAATADFSDPGDLEFCSGGNIDVNVNTTVPTGSYDWYTAQTNGTLLGNSTGTGDVTIDFANITEVAGAAPNRTATVWVEDATSFVGNVGPATAPCSGTTEGPERTEMQFTVVNELTLVSVDIVMASYGGTPTHNFVPEIYSDNAGVPGALFGTGTGSSIPYVADVQATVDVGVLLTPGTYWLTFQNSGNLKYLNCGGAFPYTDAGGNITIDGARHDNNSTANYGSAFNWEVSRGSLYPCGRAPVLINENCPPCTQPTSAGLATNSGNTAFCAGDNEDLDVSYNITALTPTVDGNWYYTIFDPSNTAIYGPATTAPGGDSHSLGALATGDAGTYTFRIEDGSTGDAQCYREGTVAITVDAVPAITSSLAESECSGDAFNYTITADIAGSSFSWARAAVAGITPATGAGATSSIAETLTSTNTTATAVTYELDATGPAPGLCAATQQDLILTVNPVPTITNVFDETVCGGAATTAVTLTADVAGTTYSWTAVSSSGNLGGGFDVGPTAGNIPSENITNTGNTSETVTYTITPTAGTCTGTDATHVVTVDPAPVVNETGQTDKVCSGDAHGGLALTSTPAGATFNWTAASSSVNVTGFTAVGNGDIPAEALTNSGSTVETVTYTITPTAAGCPGGAETFVVTVNPDPDVSNTPTSQTMCSGTPTGGVTLTSNVVGTTFDWTAANAGGNITGFTAAGNGDIPSETLTNNGAGSEDVTYTVIPTFDGCAGTAVPLVYTVTLDPPPVIDNVVMAETVCSGQSSAGVTVTSTPSAGVNYNWTTSMSSGNVTIGTTAGATGSLPAEVATNSGTSAETITYTVTPSTAICTGPTWDYVLTVNPLPVPDIQPLTTRCEGDVFTVSNANHAGGSTYVWSTTGTGASDDGSTTQDLEITAGSGNIGVTVTETDGNGCASNAVNASINVDEFPTIPVGMTDFDACIADAITLPGTQATIGTGVWTFASTNAATVDDVNLFNSGVSGLVGSEVITATWTISNGVCPDQAETIAITGRGIADPTVSLSVDDDLVCAGDVITFTASGNNGGSTPLYTFFDGQNGTVQAQGASTTLALTATQDTSIYVELESNSSCLSDPLLNTAISATIDITVDAVPSTSAAGTDIVVCQNTTTMAATAVLSGQGTWEKVSGPGTVVPGDENNPTASVNGLDQTTPTLYNWVVRSANDACPSSTDDVQIEQAGDLSPSDVAGQSVTICETAAVPVLTGSAFDAAANPAESGTWSAVAPATIAQAGLNGTIANLQTGVNKFVWEIANGLCVPSNTDTVYITVDAAPDAAVYNGLNPLETCGATEQLDAQALTVGTGTWTYVSGPGNIIAGEENLPNARVENLVTGTTSEFMWSTENGVCTGNSVNVEVVKLADISPAEIGVGGDLTLALGAATSADLCETGSYNILSSPYAADELGTWSTISGTSVTIAADNSNSQAMTINSAGTTQVQWSIAKTLGGTCPALTVTMDLIVHAAPTATVTASSVDTCENTAITFTGGVIGATDQGTWTASGATSTVAPGSENNPILSYSALPVGTTTLTFEVDNAGCAPISASESVTIEAVADPTITIDYTGSTTLCAPANLTLPTTTTGGGAAPQYTWTVNGPVDATNTASTYSESNIAAGFYTYEVTLNSSSRCVTSNNVTDDITISFVDGPTPQILENDTTSCANAPVVLTATGVQGAVQWYNASGAIASETSNTIVISSAGTYSYTDDIGTCPPVGSNNVQVSFETVPNAIAMEDTSICLKDDATIPLTGAVNTANWHWTNEAGDVFGQNTSPAFANETVGGVYVFTLHAEGTYCPDATDDVTVYLQTDVKPFNVFTPNGDGVNDTWTIEGIETHQDATVRIFNRWGAPIFEIYRGYADEPWNGQVNGKDNDNVGTYYYIIETASDACGGAQKGYVELMR